MNAIADKLFKIHTHAELAYNQDPDQIVYREKDVVNLLVSLGHEPPVWDEDEEVHNEEVHNETPAPVERSELWHKIYDKVRELPRAVTDCDAVDHPSLATSLEQLLIREMNNAKPRLKPGYDFQKDED